MTNTCVSKLIHHWFRCWLVAWSSPSHFLNRCGDIINWTLGTNFSESWSKLHMSFIRVYVCDYWNPHPHRNIVVRNCLFIKLDATLRRWGRSGDCQVDGGVPVVVNSTAIGAAPGALTVAAGVYPSILIIYRVNITSRALFIYLICHSVINYVF